MRTPEEKKPLGKLRCSFDDNIICGRNRVWCGTLD